MPSPKDLVSYFVASYGLESINWGLQGKIAKELLSKYSYNQLTYAINFYKERGVNVYSLGFLKTNMKQPMSLYNMEKNLTDDDRGDITERNKTKIRNNKTVSRERDFEYLFTEPGETD